MGLCEKWTQEWDHSFDDYEFCEKFKAGQDFCIQNNYPDLNFIRKFFDTSSLENFGVFVDKDFSNEEFRMTNGTFVFLGNCSGRIVFPRWSSALLYVRDNCKLKVIAREYSRISVRIYDKVEIDSEIDDRARMKIRDFR